MVLQQLASEFERVQANKWTSEKSKNEQGRRSSGKREQMLDSVSEC